MSNVEFWPGQRHWWSRCIVSDGKSPKPLSNLHNALVALRCDPDVKDALIFDEFAQQALLVHPVRSPMAPFPQPLALEDSQLTQIREWMQSCGLKLMSRDTVHEAVIEVAREHSFHPVRDWLDGLEWDGVDRNSQWLHRYCGAAASEANTLFGALFLISMVARIYEPGCKADYMLVLEGDQGKMKSMICAVLGAPWFSDSLPEITGNGKDTSMHLRGRWLCEIPELHAFNRAETTHLKSFISRPTERFRPPYGRMEVEEPRQCVFIGTTNKDAYLKDETGGRRFWPVKIGVVDIVGLEADRAQLFAQACADYRAGKSWWPHHEFEAQHIRPLQESRYDADDAWEEPIAHHLESKSVTTFSEILDVLEFSSGNGASPGVRETGEFRYEPGSSQHKTPINRVSKADQNRIKAILIKLGWERAGRQNAEGRSLWVRRPT